jgi:AraC family transcriptional activator of pobA
MAAYSNQHTSQAPAVDFYGDASAWPMSELLHSEPLVERSELHNWRIRAHRHNDLTQIFLVLKGSAQARLDSVWHEVAAPSLLVIPQRVVHEFEWDKAAKGYVLSIRSELVHTLVQKMKPVAAAFQSAKIIDVTESRRFIHELFAEIHTECVDQRSLRDASLESMLRVLAIWLTRNSDSRSMPVSPPDRAARHLAKFVRAVDEQHKAHWSIAQYANALGLTPSHLNTICRKLADKSALDLVHARLLLAARRQLVYTERNIAGVAHHLGFVDPSYFTRFFKRKTGMTPGAYRRRSGTIYG